VDPLGVLGLLVIVALWWCVSALGVLPPVFLPSPIQVASVIAGNFFSSSYLANFNLGTGGFAASLLYTTTNVLLALVISCLAGITLGLTSDRVDVVRAVVDPILMTAGTIPILVTAPFFLIWFGTGRAGQVVLLTIYATVIVYLFAQRAAANLDPVYESAARTLGAGPIRILAGVYLRGTLPQVLGGIRIALAGAWGLEAFAELLGAPNGIGRVIQGLATSTDIPTIMAAILVLAIAALGCDAIVAATFGYITRWRPAQGV
jgi:ABC-type nitrate/sulfonate/bicarbonate transport system permease component